MTALISLHPVQRTIAIHFHHCNPVLLAQNTYSILFRGIFLIMFNRVSGGIWQYNVGIRQQIEISIIKRNSVTLRRGCQYF